MRIALLQDEIYLPSLAGGIKANRYLLEALAGRGHECFALTRALTRSPDGPRTMEEFHAALSRRGITARDTAPGIFAYGYCNVTVEAIDLDTESARTEYFINRLAALAPDIILVADDKRRILLPSAVAAKAGIVVPLIQTIMQLPFGPLAVQPDREQHQLMRQATPTIVISRYIQRYVEQYGQLNCRLMHLPVYGSAPYPDFSRNWDGHITMINPCDLKGVSIFLDLARHFPQHSFAAVPTWGCTDELLQELQSRPNITILPAADRIDDILSRTRILLVPSLWPETFGYVVPEAMLRGIPVLAADIGGLPEAKLGVDYLLPVRPAERQGNQYVCPPQDIEPWTEALGRILTSREAHEQCATASRQAATEFVSSIRIEDFEAYFHSLANRQAV